MKINNEPKLDFDDVLLVPQRTRTSSRANIKLERNFTFYHSTSKWDGIPIFAANMDTTGTVAMSKTLAKFGLSTCFHKHYDQEFLAKSFTNQNYQWYSIGIKPHDLQNLEQFIEKTNTIPNICVDVANGYTDDFVNFCRDLRVSLGKEPIIMAGNVCTPEMVQELILHGGVDIVKIGIGPGSACTTRLKTGVGFPQLSAIIECSHAAHGLKSGKGRLGLICADGGCRTPSDICKAFSAGSDFVMIGGMLAGTDECEGDWDWAHFKKNRHGELSEIEQLNGLNAYEEKVFQKKCLRFYGMSSHKAQEKYGGVKVYRASEGRVKIVPYKGGATEVVEDILGGLRSACSYIGATCLKDMNKCAEFNLVNRTHFDQSI
jgi:GMP reductase